MVFEVTTNMETPDVICKFWHVLGVDRRRLYGNRTRTDVPPLSSSSSSSSASSSSPLSGFRAGMIDMELLPQPIGLRSALFA
ncbi:hypothetical protein EYF80_001999 [Liparis tanakae]|uniref:Uncharacterized protein n=1 Tax=Liparis tanakae TaxID=230148 RepID=A0A4Z2JEH7_9TELE|nr:hypothetical protein EYF80_001999 [Liparis tanakae]